MNRKRLIGKAAERRPQAFKAISYYLFVSSRPVSNGEFAPQPRIYVPRVEQLFFADRPNFHCTRPKNARAPQHSASPVLMETSQHYLQLDWLPPNNHDWLSDGNRLHKVFLSIHHRIRSSLISDQLVVGIGCEATSVNLSMASSLPCYACFSGREQLPGNVSKKHANEREDPRRVD